MKRSLPRLLVLFGVLLTQAGCSDLLGFGESDEAPVLESATPEDGSTGVSALAALTLRFTTPVDVASLAEGITLEAGGRPVVVEFASPDEGTVLLTPSDPLDFGTEYRVVLTPAITSRAGVAMETTTSWAFTTRGMAPPVPSPDSLRGYLEVLAHDSMGGRWSGSEDELRAARYLEDRFLAFGLEVPAGGMIQPFEAMSRRGDTLVSSRNVLAAVPGSGALSDEWLVVGAHYDHVGFRNLEDRSGGPNNGADDNGSGTVLVLEMARLLQAYVDAQGMAGTDRRSVLFMGFGAEEEGLLGSCHYVFEAPVVPLSQTRAMMNFDMVGRLRGVLTVSGQETADDWTSLVANANAPDVPLVMRQTSSASGTDHACFWMAGVPWVGFFTDFHDEYHNQGDDVELINFPGMVGIGELAFRVLTRLLVMPESPAFTGAIPGLMSAPFLTAWSTEPSMLSRDPAARSPSSP